MSHCFITVVCVDVTEIEFGAELAECLGTFAAADFEMRIAGAPLDELLIGTRTVPRIDRNDTRRSQQE